MTDRTNSVAAAEELLKRRSTRKSFAEWAKHKGLEPAAHHRLIINGIESFLESDDEVLLLFAPPVLPRVPMSLSCYRLGTWQTIQRIAFWQPPITWSLPRDGGGESATTSLRTKTSLASSSPKTARQPRGRRVLRARSCVAARKRARGARSFGASARGWPRSPRPSVVESRLIVAKTPTCAAVSRCR